MTRRAGIAKHVTPHTMRHAFITAALDAGVPLRDVQEAASHADPRTTMRYDRARTSLDRHPHRCRVHRRGSPVIVYPKPAWPLSAARQSAARERRCTDRRHSLHHAANRRLARRIRTESQSFL